MYDALQATKEFALDCHTYGTTFRLGVSTISVVMATIVPSLMNTLLFMNGDICGCLILYTFCFRQAVLRNFLEKFLPKDVHLKVNGKIRDLFEFSRLDFHFSLCF